MWDLIVSVPDHCLSFYFDGSKMLKGGDNQRFICPSWKHLRVKMTSSILHLYSKKQDW